MDKPRFTLKAILGCTLALSMPLAIMAAGQELGFIFLFPTAGGCVGYLMAGWPRVMDGAICGAFVAFVLIVTVMFLRPG